MVKVDRWSFSEPRNCVTFVTAQVLERAEPILHAVHDEDGEWQFIGSSDGTAENGRVITLQEAVELDPSVLQLADMPVGWHALRDSPEHAWRREAIDDAHQTIQPIDGAPMRVVNVG
jgi:hypothetical protein